MAVRDEQADILGGPILQRPESGVFAIFSQYHPVFKSVILLGLGLLVWIACARGVEHLQKHRELRYRKAMRRKHGIPDSDCRPFTVAYAAAKRAHLEREAHERKRMTNDVSDHNSPAVDQKTNAQKDACLRRRVPETTVQHHDHHLPGKHAAVYDDKPSEVHSLDFADRYHPNPRRQLAVPDPLPVEGPPVRRTSRKVPVINFENGEASRKRTFEAESDVEHETMKKYRMGGDTNEQADWYAQYLGRASPRVFMESLDRQPEGNYVHMSGQEGPKRVDDLRNEDHERDKAMEGIDEDEITELEAVARGRKRDRTEAGSSFGGDDEEDIQNGRVSHHRKRRTILRKKVEMPVRGQKRDREVESPDSEGEGVGSETLRGRVQHIPKKKRGKEAASDEMSVEDLHVSKDPLCGGRRIGDGWEADGVQYKVGESGERLRLTLVKKARNKYHMPQDSQHPDRSAALDIYVEMWLTEEQYKQAEGKQELAWQETSRESSGSWTPDVLDSPTKNGKNLLWDSVRCNPTRRPFRQFVPSSALTRINPFEQLQPISGRRVASSSAIVSPILPGVADSPTRPGFRGFSKWEKQDREAEALARIRAKVEEEKKAQTPPQKPVETPTGVTTSEFGTKSLSVPTITFTTAPTIAAEGKPDSSTLPNKPNTSTFSLTAHPSTSDSTAPSATASSFSSSSSTIPAATSSVSIPSAPTSATATSPTSSLPPFSFVKPSQATPTPALSSTTSNIFGKGLGTNTPSSSAPLSSTLGATTQPPSTDGVSKLVPFSFAKPDSSSSTSSPAVAAPPIVNPPTPISNATSGSFSSPMAFSSTLASTKAETSIPPPTSTSATTSESSKPTAPLFSFSGSSLPSSTGAPPASSAPPTLKFSFGQPATTPAFAPGSNLAPSTAPQPKLTFKFGQTVSGAIDGALTASAVDESKKSGMPVAVFGATAGLNGPTKPPPFETTSVLGKSTYVTPSASATNLFGKPVTSENDSLTSMPPKPIAPASTTMFDSSTPAGALVSSSVPVFPFGGPNSVSKSAEASKPATMSGDAAAGSNPVAPFSGNSTEGKPTFTFSASTDGPRSKATSVFGSSAEGSKPAFTFGSSAELGSVFGEGSKSTFTFNGAAENKSVSGPAMENPKPASLFASIPNSSQFSNPVNPPKLALTPASGSTSFTPFSSAQPLGKGERASSTSTSTSMQAQPTATFTFGASPSAKGPTFGQSSVFGPNGDSVFGKPTNVTPNAFGFAGTGGTSSSSTFTFGKSTAQNQKQEQ